MFKAGLARGLVSKEEVTKWADEIILLEDEPDSFFIEISLIISKIEGINFLGEHLESDSLACRKAIPGLLYKRFKGGQEFERIVKAR